MKHRNLITLTVVSVALLGVAMWISQQRAPQTSKETAVLLPGLKEEVNAIDKISIQSADETIIINRKDSEWTIEQLDSYPALFDKVKQTILSVAELEIISGKTTNPDLYSRLGVEDITEKNSTANLLSLSRGDTVLASLLVGNARRSKSPTDQPGLYVRLPDSGQALLVAGTVDISAKSRDWFDRNVIDIAADDVRLITIELADHEPLVLLRQIKDTDLLVKNIPEGREAQAEAIISQTGTILEGVFAQGVKRDINLQNGKKISDVTVKTFSGLVIHSQLVEADGEPYVLFVASAEDPPNSETEEPPADDSQEAAELPDPQEQADNINLRLSRWGYVLPEHKINLFKKTMEELTREKTATTEE